MLSLLPLLLVGVEVTRALIDSNFRSELLILRIIFYMMIAIRDSISLLFWVLFKTCQEFPQVWSLDNLEFQSIIFIWFWFPGFDVFAEVIRRGYISGKLGGAASSLLLLLGRWKLHYS